MTSTSQPGAGPAPTASVPRERNTTLPGLIAKIIFLGIVLAIGVYAVPLLIHYKMWMWLAVMVAAVVLIFAIYLTKRFIPGKYLFPGTAFLTVFLIIPVVLTVSYSFTNFGDGSRSSKEDMIAAVESESFKRTPDSPIYTMAVGVAADQNAADGPFTLFLISMDDADQTVLAGRHGQALAPWDGDAPTVADGRVTAVPGYQLLTPRQINTAYAELQAMDVAAPGDGQAAIKPQTPTQAYQGKVTIKYDAAGDRLVSDAGVVYPNQTVGTAQCFVAPDGKCFQGKSWLQNVGLKNYSRLLTDSGIRTQFLAAFAWTLVFSLASVCLTFLLGFFLALTLNDERVRGQKGWRAFLLLPYAIPGMISLLIWSQFFNKDFGLINQLFGLDVNWFGDPTMAKIAVILVQLWMGFPYMFIVCTGALQSIPGDVKEAARIDGSTGLSTTFRIIMPLLLISVAPLLVASFAFNFNNFNAIQLLTQGGPSLSGQFTRGGTDILISMIYKQAFGGSGTDFGFASAMSVLLFVLTGVLAAVQFRITKRLENLT
ncbi:MAG: ABC transporter permease subunit [Bifidobacteriaceae bacterium]|jgi:arabinogalactan oligomer/maltooligosaccharide transport system permease protein|nr:ABC transporter permease subunit [Bifidobacteriaceae bacterium]